MSIELKGNRVLIETIKSEDMTKSGLYLSKTKEVSDFQEGVIKHVGTGKYEAGTFVAVPFKVGDKVLFNYGTNVTIEGTTYVMVNEGDVAAILTA